MGAVLVCEAFGAVPAIDDAAVAETFAKDGGAHDSVVAVGVDAD